MNYLRIDPDTLHTIVKTAFLDGCLYGMQPDATDKSQDYATKELKSGIISCFVKANQQMFETIDQINKLREEINTGQR